MYSNKLKVLDNLYDYFESNSKNIAFLSLLSIILKFYFC